MLWKSTFRVEDMAREKSIVYLSFTSANGNYGKLVTTLVTNAISALRREAARQGGHLRRECYLLLEEMAQMERIDTIYSDAGIMRGEGIHLLLVLQEKSQQLTKYTREEAASLTGCCDDTLVLSVNELEVAKELSGKIGTYPALMRTSSRSRGSNAGTMYGTFSNGITTASQRRELITPDEMLRWGPEVGNLLIGHGGVYALPSPELSKTHPFGCPMTPTKMLRRASRRRLPPRGNGRATTRCALACNRFRPAETLSMYAKSTGFSVFVVA